METSECIRTRRSCRVFDQREVEEDRLFEVVEAGRCAPSGGDCQTTHFVVIEDPSVLRELADAVQKAFSEMEIEPDMYVSLVNSIRASKKGRYAFHYGAPVLIVVANKKGYGNALPDSACALQNMMLAANDLGLGSCWINQLRWLDENEDVRSFMECLGVLKDEMVCGALSLGYAKRLNRSEKIHEGYPVTWVRAE